MATFARGSRLVSRKMKHSSWMSAIGILYARWHPSSPPGDRWTLGGGPTNNQLGAGVWRRALTAAVVEMGNGLRSLLIPCMSCESKAKRRVNGKEGEHEKRICSARACRESRSCDSRRETQRQTCMSTVGVWRESLGGATDWLGNASAYRYRHFRMPWCTTSTRWPAHALTRVS